MTIYLYALTCMWSFKKYACSRRVNCFKFTLLCVSCYYIHIQWQLCASYRCAIAVINMHVH